MDELLIRAGPRLREACRLRTPLNGADAEALEHVLTQCEADLKTEREGGRKDAIKEIADKVSSWSWTLLYTKETVEDFIREHDPDWLTEKCTCGAKSGFKIGSGVRRCLDCLKLLNR